MPEKITRIVSIERTISTKTIEGFDSKGRKFVTRLFKIPVAGKHFAGLMDHGWNEVLWLPSVEKHEDDGTTFASIGWLATKFTFCWGDNPLYEKIVRDDLDQESLTSVAGL